LPQQEFKLGIQKNLQARGSSTVPSVLLPSFPSALKSSQPVAETQPAGMRVFLVDTTLKDLPCERPPPLSAAALTLPAIPFLWMLVIGMFRLGAAFAPPRWTTRRMRFSCGVDASGHPQQSEQPPGMIQRTAQNVRN